VLSLVPNFRLARDLGAIRTEHISQMANTPHVVAERWGVSQYRSGLTDITY
jgi:hypothetical protein